MKIQPSILLLSVLGAALFAVPVATAVPADAQTVEQNDSSAQAARRANALPLIPSRALDFTTDEGTWIDVDLHPDGETILFELLGDLYTIPVAGGEATRITSGQGYDMQPRYSVDGSEIVFVSDRDGSENIWVANADGSDPRQLTDTERDNYMSPVWTPDGEYVMANKGTQLWLWHEDGGSGVQITGQGGEGGPGGGPPGFGGGTPSHTGAAFGPDARYVWVNVRGNLGGGFPVGGTNARGPGAGASDPFNLDPDPPGHFAAAAEQSSARQVGAFQIGMLDRETGRVMVRTHEHEGAFRPMPSPDGRWLAYATRYDAREALKLLDLATGEETWLVMDVQRDESQGGGMRDRDVYPGGAWTPDSEALITFYGGKIMRVQVPSGEAAEIPFTAHIQQDLGPLVKFDYPINDSLLTVSQIRGARPSPDGTRLVFSRSTASGPRPCPTRRAPRRRATRSSPTRAASPPRTTWSTARPGRRTAAISHT